MLVGTMVVLTLFAEDAEAGARYKRAPMVSKRADEDSDGQITIKRLVPKPGRSLPVIQLEAFKSK
jgi:hypothetical protein